MAEFSPVGNSLLAIAGEDYVMIAIDEPNPSQPKRHTHNQFVMFNITSNTMLASAVCWCEQESIHNLLMARIKYYEELFPNFNSVEWLAPIIARYSPRLVPNYRSNVCIGLDSKGRGAIYSNESANSYDRFRYFAAGVAGEFLYKLLCNRIDGVSKFPKSRLTKDCAVFFAVECFKKVIERNEMLVVNVFSASEIEKYEIPLGQ